MMNNTYGKLSIKEKVGYALGDMASNLYFQTFVIFLLNFYTDVFGIPAAAAGTLFLVTRIFDAVNDPIMGTIADRVNTRWGKFRPFVFFFSIPMAIAGVFAFTTPDYSVSGKLIYAYITYNFLMVMYTIVNVPYSSLMAVITPNSLERTVLSSYRFVAVFCGGLIVQGSVLYLVEYFGNGNDAVGWQWAMGCLGVLAVILLFITFISTKERVHPPKGQKVETKRDLKDLITNKAWLLIGGATVFQLIFIVMRSSSIVYYFKYYILDQKLDLFGLGYNLSIATLTSSFLVIGSLFNILGAILTKWLSKTFDKKNTYVGMLLTSSVVNCMFYFLQPENVILIYLLNFIVSFAWGPVSVLQWAMYTDAADFSEWKNGRRATGLLMAASLFTLKLGLTLGGALVGWILAFYGFVPNQAQTAESTAGIILLLSVYPSIFGFIGAILMFFYPLNNKMMIKIEEDLTARRKDADDISVIPEIS
jgi:GPH family glycoside/pentoside/hexuronide:cation symporter